MSCKLVAGASGVIRFIFNYLAEILHEQSAVKAPMLKMAFSQKTKFLAQAHKASEGQNQNLTQSCDSRGPALPLHHRTGIWNFLLGVKG